MITATTESETTANAAASGLVVSFIIPALNEEKFIKQCLVSISAIEKPQQVSEIEIVVVDNESTDRTVEISEANRAKVITCPPGRPSVARNLGAKQATGDWLAFIDADCEPASDWLIHCYRSICEQGVVAVGGRVLVPQQAEGWVARTAGELFNPPGDGKSRDVTWLASGGLAVSTKVFRAVGGFNESLTTCEDCELSYRLIEHGRLVHNPAAELIHHGESRTLREIFAREAWRSSDNMRLAFSRPHDLRNWLSVLLPVVFSGLLIAGVVGLTVSLFTNMSLWYGVAAVLGSLMLLPLITWYKTRGSLKPKLFAGQLVILATYFLGRSVGLLGRFSRVER